MSVSLDYCTTDAVSEQVKQAIEADAEQLNAMHDWWAESLHFFDTGEDDGRLHGGTKIFLSGYSTDDGGYREVDADDDSLMAFRDTRSILAKLAEWSGKHGLAWQVYCVGEPIGTISAGQWDQQLREYVDAMKTSFPTPASFDEKVKAILEAHASR